ncbi:MAG: bifunctional pyr operon transcriptional regulator/uracil phosphoribosyltransferase PyrR [Aminivibrio sp.]|jgi:pyrimidine operon attenuation protein/uracil phosphoribosyltransferase
MVKQDGWKWLEKVTVMGPGDMERVLRRIAVEIVERNKGLDRVILLGIQRRGVHLAARIRELFREEEKVKVPSGELDITLYRDDISVLADQPVVHSTSVPGDITGKRIILIDDVLFTGRTVRAALDAITDLGRPERVQLAVLVDRGHRELPIAADYVGKIIPTSRSENVEVRVKELDGEDKVIICELEGGGSSGMEA